MKVITRFAPSPTGRLHVGNIRTALVNWLLAKSKNGTFILRIDDTDLERSKDFYVEAIKEDLLWLGITWDKTFSQSLRMEKYEVAKQRLIDSGRLYRCYETQEELALRKKNLLSRNLPPIYDRASLKLTKDQIASLESQGIKPHWRFLLNDSPISWVDGVKGEMHFDSGNLNDPILIRADGSMTYTLASVVDDIEFGITDIVRGDDHLSNSATHIQIFEALGALAPKFAHLSLLKSKDSEISKRLGGFDIKSLRDEGIEPMAIAAFLAKIGTSEAIQPHWDLKELIETFSIEKFSKSPITYDKVDLEKLNEKIVHGMSYEIVRERLETEKIPLIDRSFWELAKHNISNLKQINIWWEICNTVLYPGEDIDYSLTKVLATILPKEPWDQSTYDNWILAMNKVTNVKGKELFMSIRRALSGLESGPELRKLLTLIGYEKAFKRLNGIAA
jgi:glutamyl-tRNA synthetase